jgi:DamX protein
MSQAQTLRNQTTPVLDITNYWQHYGLRQDPFAILADDSIYYSLARWEEYLDLLQYLCQYNNVLLVVTGVAGSGKTTLKNRYVAQVSNAMQVCELAADPGLNTARLVESLGDGFDLPWDTEETLEEQLNAQLSRLQESDRISLLVIDDAHLLPADTLRALITLVKQQSEERMQLHVLLYGEPHLQASLQRLMEAEDCENLIHTIALEPFTLEETESYIQHRLNTTGLIEQMPLTLQAIGRIYKLSEGVPGRINRIARRTLLNALARQQVAPRGNFFRARQFRLWGGIMFLLLVVAVAATTNWQHMGSLSTGKSLLAFNDRPAPRSIASISSSAGVALSAIHPSHLLAANDVEITPAMSAKMQGIDVNAAKSQASNNNAASGSGEGKIIFSAAQPSAVAEEKQRMLEQALRDSAAPKALPAQADQTSRVQPALSAPAQPVQTSRAQPALSAPTQPVQTSRVQPALSAPTQPAQISRVQLALATPAQPDQTSRMQAALPTPAPAPQATVLRKAEPVPPPPPRVNDEQEKPRHSAKHSKAAPAGKNHYTLQLMGLSKEESAEKFLAKHSLAKASYVHTRLHGKDWYVVLYGKYKTAEDAMAAVKKLPEELQALKPWPRTLSGVHKVT